MKQFYTVTISVHKKPTTWSPCWIVISIWSSLFTYMYMDFRWFIYSLCKIYCTICHYMHQALQHNLMQTIWILLSILSQLQRKSKGMLVPKSNFNTFQFAQHYKGKFNTCPLAQEDMSKVIWCWMCAVTFRCICIYNATNVHCTIKHASCTAS